MNIQTVIMKELIAPFLLCIIAFLQVESYIVTVDVLDVADVDSPLNVTKQDYQEYDEQFQYANVYQYKITFNESHPDAGDIPIKGLYVDENNNVVQVIETSLCNADVSNADGTVAALVAMVLGVIEDQSCPREGSEFTQKSVFQMAGGDFSNLPNSTDEDDLISVKLKVFSSIYMAIELSITDGSSWFEDSDDGPAEDTSNEEKPAENEE